MADSLGAVTTKQSFGATSSTDQVLAGVDLRGKRILVTGVSAGLGVETARSLAAHGAHVLGAARDLDKAERATAQVRKDAAANGGGFRADRTRSRQSEKRAGLRRSIAEERRALRRNHR